MSKLKWIIILSILTSTTLSCAKKEVIKRYYLTKEKTPFSYEVQPKVWKKTYISPKFEQTAKANFTLSVINIKKDNILKLDPDLQFAFLVLSGEGLFYSEDKKYFLKEDIAGYGCRYSAYINAKEELSLILLEKKASRDQERCLISKDLFWLKKIKLPEHKNVYAKIIFHPQEDKTNFLLALVQVYKGGTNINFDIHSEQHGFFCLEGKIKGKFYNEAKEVTIKKNDTIFIEGNLPHIFTGIAQESLILVYKG